MCIYGIGVDIVQNKRMRQLMFKSYIQNFLRKVLHQQQHKQYKSLKLLSMQTQFIASKWAVKQATVKALGRKQLIFAEMRIIKNIYGNYSQFIQGKPYLSLEGQTNLNIKKQLNIGDLHVSLTHEDQYTVAYAMATVKYR